jgi:tetratricopeptide (TPR) repeat protein
MTEPTITISEAFARAQAYFHAGRYQLAERLYHAILQQEPQAAEAYSHLGTIYRALGNVEAAYRCYQRALHLQPQAAEVHVNLGNLYHLQGQFAAAVACYRRALVYQPDAAAVRCNLGVALAAQDAISEALVHIQQAIEVHPELAVAWCNLGHLLHGQGRIEEAIAPLQQAVRLQPDLAEAHNNLGAVYLEQGDLLPALRHLRQALRLKPEYAEALSNLGSALLRHGQRSAALAHHQAALRLQPTCAEVHWNHALALLTAGDLQQGWLAYEWRWRTARYRRRLEPYPAWDGTPLAGRSLLVRAEQGVGDELLFASCFPELIATAGRVLIECDARLLALFARSFPSATLLTRHDETHSWPALVPEDSMATFAGSLPRFMRRTLGHFPPQPGYLVPEPTRLAHWQQRLAALGPGLRVGLSWRSRASRRHLPHYTQLCQWEAVFRVLGIHWVNMQYDDYTAELAEVANKWGVRIHHWPDLDTWHDLDNLAALMAAVDLVIAPDTTVAQLAAGIGVPVWRLTVCEEDEMGLGTGIQPWGPTMRLYRQPRPGDWSSVLQRLAVDIQDLTVTVPYANSPMR